MAKIFITGSSDGLGLLAAQLLLKNGEEVVLHARNDERARVALEKAPTATTALIGDLSSLEETKQLAEAANELGLFDAVIHNAGVYQASSESIFMVNSLAPYILTAIMHKPKRLIYMSSGMHTGGISDFENFAISKITYSTSKLHNVLIAKAMARIRPEIYSNAVDPGWVPTRMGGKTATGNLQKGYETQAWLATSSDSEALVTGKYFYHQQERDAHPTTDNIEIQQAYLDLCEMKTDLKLNNPL